MAENLDKILELARNLGQAIRQHPRYTKLREADQRVRDDKSATDALAAYNQATGEIARKERSGQPIEPEDKRKLEQLHKAVATQEAIKGFMAAQADYAELMRKMNDTIFSAITGPAETPKQP